MPSQCRVNSVFSDELRARPAAPVCRTSLQPVPQLRTDPRSTSLPSELADAALIGRPASEQVCRSPATPPVCSRQRRCSPMLPRSPSSSGEARPPDYASPAPLFFLRRPLVAFATVVDDLQIYCAFIFRYLCYFAKYCIFGLSSCLFAFRSFI